jgi:Na+-translocating ferredoxin:NAD+ oxidoreductase RnfD subunit
VQASTSSGLDGRGPVHCADDRAAPTQPPVPDLGMTARTIAVGGTAYPLILPNVRDPRLHVAAVIITIHVLGQVALGFHVSIPQILAAILTCAIIEVALTFRQSRAFVWPASAMLTGSGVALILRVVGMPPGEPWSFDSWYVFAGVAGFSLLTKYVIKYRGSHVFNPSNFGLVVAFVVLGSTRIEPLDFWWGPLDPALLAAYAVIIGGGLLITRRLKLLALAGSFWLALVVGVGLLAGSGHCMTANWAFAPVCGVDFWRVIVTSPEVMIFLFFMITDPKTVPAGRVGRVAFGILVAVASTLLIAPQTDEFGTKVALLSGLVLMCAVRPLLDRMLPEPKSATDEFGRFATRLATGGSGAGFARGAVRVGLIAIAVLGIGVGIVAAGTPARGTFPSAAVSASILERVPHDIDPATFPAITVDPDVVDFDHEMAGSGAQALVLTLAENLELENQALLRGDDAILTAVDHGDRLDAMRARLQDARAAGLTTISRYAIDDVNVALIVPFGRQDGLSMGLESRGTLTEDTYDAAGALVGQRSAPFEQTFVMRRATGGRWLNVAVLPPDTGG